MIQSITEYGIRLANENASRFGHRLNAAALIKRETEWLRFRRPESVQSIFAFVVMHRDRDSRFDAIVSHKMEPKKLGWRGRAPSMSLRRAAADAFFVSQPKIELGRSGVDSITCYCIHCDVACRGRWHTDRTFQFNCLVLY